MHTASCNSQVQSRPSITQRCLSSTERISFYLSSTIKLEERYGRSWSELAPPNPTFNKHYLDFALLNCALARTSPQNFAVSIFKPLLSIQQTLPTRLRWLMRNSTFLAGDARTAAYSNRSARKAKTFLASPLSSPPAHGIRKVMWM